MDLTTWFKQKWAAMFPGRVYILSGGRPSNAWPVLNTRLPASHRLTSRPPNYEAGWDVSWEWLEPKQGLTLDHPNSGYTVVRVAEGVPPGSYPLECVYTRRSDGAQFVSSPFLVNVTDAALNE